MSSPTGSPRCHVPPWSSENRTKERTVSPSPSASPSDVRNQPAYGWTSRPACGPCRSRSPVPEVGKAVRISSGGAAIAVTER